MTVICGTNRPTASQIYSSPGSQSAFPVAIVFSELIASECSSTFLHRTVKDNKNPEIDKSLICILDRNSDPSQC